MLNHEQQIELRDLIIEHFNLDEIKVLFQNIGEDIENVSGSAKTAKALELVQLCRRKSKLDQLVSACVKMRPELQWPGGPPPKPANTRKPDPLPSNSKITILFMAANPVDTDRLSLGVERRTIDERLQLSPNRERYVLEEQWALRVGDLQPALLRYKPSIVHFSGHGSLSGELAFEDMVGKAQKVKTEGLAGMLALIGTVRCVVLSACWSNMQAQVIADKVGCVIGMSRDIADSAARDFAEAFYTSLGHGMSVGQAFEWGKNRIMLTQLEEAAIPRIRTRAGVDAESLLI
jgi:Effector-associated domain 7/CHAT domain